MVASRRRCRIQKNYLVAGVIVVALGLAGGGLYAMQAAPGLTGQAEGAGLRSQSGTRLPRQW